MSIIVMICFARSGGTILNQCLGSLSNTLVISESTPLIVDSNKDATRIGMIKDQAKQWHHIDLKSNDFVESALELEKITAERRCQLVIRDWTYSSFFPFGNNPSPPPDKLVTLDVLEKSVMLFPFALFGMLSIYGYLFQKKSRLLKWKLFFRSI